MKLKEVGILLVCGLIITGCGKKDISEKETTLVVTQVLKPQKAINAQNFSGVVNAIEQVSISPEAEATVQKIYVEVGDNVKKGAVLAQLEDTINKARYEQAKSAYELAKQTFERQTALYKDAVISKQQYETFESQYKQAQGTYIIAKKNYEDCQIKAPITGSIAARNLVVGAQAERKFHAFVMVDYSKIEVPFGVTDREIAKIAKGKNVTITIDTLPGKTFPGKITSVGMLADDRTGTYPVKAEVANSKYLIKPGMIAQVKVPLDYAAKAKAVPLDSIVLNGEQRGVFTVSANIVSYIPASIIFEFGDQAYISSNIQFGQKVVVKGQASIVNGEEVLITENSK